MKVLLVALGALAALAVVALTVGPRLVDWNRFKPEIAALAERATGDRLTIDGDVALSVLPTPTLSVAGVRLLGSGAGAPELMRLTSLDARVALGPLLAGRIVVRSIALIEPRIVIDPATLDAWTSRPAGALDERVSVDRAIVVDGAIEWRGADGTVALHVDRVNAEISADAPGGPYRATGDVAWRGLSWHLDGALGGLEPGASVRASLGLRGGGATVRVTGTILPRSVVGGETWLSGHLRADTRRLPDLIAASGFADALAGAGGGLPAALGQPATLEASLTVTPARVGLDAVALTLGDDLRATGALGVGLTAQPAIDLTLAVNRVDVARWATRLPAPPSAAAPPASSMRVRGSLDLTVDAVFWRDGVIRQARLAGTLDDDGLAVRQAGAQLPGGSDVSAFGRLRVGAAPGWDGLGFEGRLEAGADNLRGLFAWLAIDLGTVPPDRLRRVSVTSGIALAADRLTLDGLDLRFDASRLTGSITATLGTRPAFGANLRLDRLNLEAYLPHDVSRTGFDWLSGFDANLELAVDQLSYDTVPMIGVRAALTLDRSALTVHALEVASAAGMRASASGTVQWAEQPAALDLALSAQADDPAPLLQLLGDDQARPEFGPLALSLHAAGPIDHVQLALDAGLAGGTLGAAGEADLAARTLGLTLTASGIALGRALPTALGASGLDGVLDATGDVNAALTAGGVSATANGRAHVQDAAIEGLDLGALATLTRPGSRAGNGVAAAVAQDLAHGRSAFATLDAGIALRDARVSIDDVVLTGPDGTVGARGALDLATRALDLTLTVQSAGDPAAPPATLRLDGALAAPTRRIDAEALASFLAARR